jgi:primosomal protein N' (replication factor Y)
VRRLLERPDFDPNKIKKIEQVLNLPPIPAIHIKFLEQVAGYYMCPIGDVFRFAAFSSVKTTKKEDNLLICDHGNESENKNHTGTTIAAESTAENSPEIKLTNFPLPTLSEEQQIALEQTQVYFKSNKPVLLNGVTGSGKTEIYIHLAAEALAQGKNVLYLVPEIALSRQIENRLKKVFGEHLMTYHSKKTAAYRRNVYKTIASNSSPVVILGARSALFLPFQELGVIIVDEEHDSSYKQTDSAPRYHGRDTALILSSILKSNIILGSATPSFESLYNVKINKFGQVDLNSRFFGGTACRITTVDMNKERK